MKESHDHFLIFSDSPFRHVKSFQVHNQQYNQRRQEIESISELT